MQVDTKKLKNSTSKAARSIGMMGPVILGMVLLVSLVITFIPRSFYVNAFHGNLLLDTLIGSTVGSILAGHPITSYILGGEFLAQGVELLVVTAFLISWVTVGIVQIPAEAVVFGKRFAILRNVSAFVLSMVAAIITVTLVGLL
ncbi:MAG: hypothetical protein ACXQTE_00640 [Methanosarcinaceae archaeon]